MTSLHKDIKTVCVCVCVFVALQLRDRVAVRVVSKPVSEMQDSYRGQSAAHGSLAEHYNTMEVRLKGLDFLGINIMLFVEIFIFKHTCERVNVGFEKLNVLN